MTFHDICTITSSAGRGQTSDEKYLFPDTYQAVMCRSYITLLDIKFFSVFFMLLVAPDSFSCQGGGGPRVVVSTAAFHARVRGSVPGLGGLKETKTVSSPSTCDSQYCGEPPWPRGSVLSLRPPGLESRILCLEDSVISIISSSSGGSPCPV